MALAGSLAALSLGMGGCPATQDTGSTRDQQGPRQPVEEPGWQPDSREVPRPYGPIARRAERVDSGTGTLRWRAPESGRVWIANDEREYVVVTRTIKRGDQVDVFPQRDRIELNDEVIYGGKAGDNLESRDTHAIWFLARDRGGQWDEIDPYGGIPDSADRVAHGSGVVSWRVDQTGRIWVGDDRNKKLVMSHPVKSGDQVQIDPKSDQVKVNGRIVFSQNLESRHEHSVFWTGR
jgi:hypothetical protein